MTARELVSDLDVPVYAYLQYDRIGINMVDIGEGYVDINLEGETI